MTAPTREPGEPTPKFLARVLTEHDAPAQMIENAERGYYDDYLSELAFPLMQLYADARSADLRLVAGWVTEGVFDATREEGDAWAKSPEGQSAFADLIRSNDEGGRDER